jgi:hypothetical protein
MAEQLRAHFAEERAALAAKDPSYALIPPLRFKVMAKMCLCILAHPADSPPRQRHAVNELLVRVRKEARTRFLEKKAEELLDEDDLEQLWTLIADRSVMYENTARVILRACSPLASITFCTVQLTYEDFCAIGTSLPPKAKCYFKPSMFLKLPRDKFGRVTARTFFHYIVRKGAQ